MNADSFTVEVLEDGTLKITTDKISAANHANMTMFLQETAKIAGGKVTQQRRAKQPEKFQTTQQKASA